jgi:hypothetical protein
MIALLCCIIAFGACYWAAKRSLGQGLVALLAVGYFYGILRANLITTFSHFIFDAGMLGLYAARLFVKATADERKRSHVVLCWVAILVLWPCLLVALPSQPLLVSLVGLRGNIFFIPLAILGSRMKKKDLIELTVGFAVLDIIALCFAGAEYVMGVPRFFPFSPVTRIIYMSSDAGGGFFRIPATFSSAHAFGGTMVASIPFLVGLWTNAEERWQRRLGLLVIPAAMLGVLMSATRQNFIIGSAMIVFVIFTTQAKAKQRVIFLLIVGAIAVVAMSNQRFQRFKSLGDTDAVTDRIAGSVNHGFWEILQEYPMGNGLGGGGTSIPYFLEGQVRNPIGMENEYARILSEQGVIGLLLWLGFVVWFLGRAPCAFAKSPWATTRRLTWSFTAFAFSTAWIGLGMLTSIPGTLILIITMGWTSVPEERASVVPSASRARPERHPNAYVFARR